MDATLSRQNYWLFSREIDLTVFLGSAVLSLLLLAVGWQLGILNGESPEWTWVSAVLFIDVAHVWSTSFRVYFDKEEFKRRFWLYLLVPVFGYAIGVALYSEGELTFWKVLAAVAVFHFVRQQYGWVALYRRKLSETENWTWWIDAAAVYLASIYPLAFWMTRLPRNFEWFVQNDFVSIPAIVETVLFPIYVVALAAYFAKSIYQYFTIGFVNIGKDIVVATTSDLLVCRHRLFQFGLCVYGDERDHTRRAVFCFDLCLCTVTTREYRPCLPNVFAQLVDLSRDALGARLFRRAVLASRCLA